MDKSLTCFVLISVRDSLTSEMSSDFNTGCSVWFVRAVIAAVSVRSSSIGWWQASSDSCCGCLVQDLRSSFKHFVSMKQELVLLSLDILWKLVWSLVVKWAWEVLWKKKILWLRLYISDSLCLSNRCMSEMADSPIPAEFSGEELPW